MGPAVSVIIPVYRGAQLIERPLASLQAQTFRDFEILCVDDCSPDESAAVIRDAARRDPRIRYLKTPRNLGIVPKVMNFAADEVRGRRFVYSSQDDTFSSDWLETMVEAAERTGADAVVPNLLFVDEDKGAFRKLINDWRDPVTGEAAFFLSLDWTIPGNALFPASFLREQGYFDFGTYADEYTARIYFLECRKVAFARGEFHYFHGNPDAITRKVSGRLLDDSYNNFRLWQLVHERFPGHEWDRKLAGVVFRSLVESEYLAATNPQLAAERSRLGPAIEGMKSSAYMASLQAHFAERTLLFQFARMIICRPALRRLAMFVHRWARRTKGRLGLLAGRPE